MKRLIVNADDFGMTEGVNRAIAECHTAGIVTSATLMATGQAFDSAVRLAKAHPNLDVGCHVALVQGNPLLSPDSVSTLCDRRAGGGRLREGFPQFALSALAGRLNFSEIEAEARAQIGKLQNAGIKVSHLDTHKHVHLFPGVLRPLLRAARDAGIRAVRNPFEPASMVRFADFLNKPRLWKRYPIIRALDCFRGAFRRLVDQFGLATTDGAIGIFLTGSLDEESLVRALRQLPPGTWELVCHPAYEDGDLRKISSLRTGDAERIALTATRVRQAIPSCGISLTTFEELARSN